MDDRRFDTVIRALAHHRSRRRLVGGLLGGGAALLASHLRLAGAAARRTHAQGEWCLDDDQCDPWLTCAWNGFGSAGAACCAPIGGGCDDDFGCCGPASCFGGTCADFASAPGFGELCDPGGNPCVYASGGFSCGWVEETQDFRCCSDAGGFCSWDGECCGDLACVGDVCRPRAGGSSVGSDTACNWEGCACQLYRDPECMASCPLYDPCGPGLSCTGTSDYTGTCVPA